MFDQLAKQVEAFADPRQIRKRVPEIQHSAVHFLALFKSSINLTSISYMTPDRCSNDGGYSSILEAALACPHGL